MWRLWHRLFGWHYVAIKYGYGYTPARVLKDGNGRPYANVCSETFLLKETQEKWFPLTFTTEPPITMK